MISSTEFPVVQHDRQLQYLFTWLVIEVPGSHKNPAKIPSTCWDPTRIDIPPTWPVFPSGGIFSGTNSCRVSQQESCREICTRRDPSESKSLLWQIPGENPAMKQILGSTLGKISFLFKKNSCLEVPTEKLHILVAQTQIPARVNS